MGWSGRRDQGSAFTQYVALVFAMAAIAAAVFIAAPGAVRNLFDIALCRLERSVSLGSGECAGARGPDRSGAEQEYEYTPAYCAREGEKATYGQSFALGIVKLGEEYSYAREELANGQVVVTFLPKREASLFKIGSLDFGGKSGDAPLHGAWDPDLSADVRYAPGMSYFFDSEKEYEEFADEVNAQILKEANDFANPEGTIGSMIIEEGMKEEGMLDVVEPTVRTQTVGFGGNGGYNFGAWAGPASREGDSYTMNLGQQGRVAFHHKIDQSTWYQDPDNIQTSQTVGWEASGNLGATVLAGHADGGLSWTGGTRVMRNEDGSLANIRYIASAEGSFGFGADGSMTKRPEGQGGLENGPHGDAKFTSANTVTQMVQLDFDTPEEQETGEQLLEEHGMIPPPYVSNSLADQLGEEDYGGGVVREPDEDAPAWDRLFYERGRAWQSTADTKTSGGGVNFYAGMRFQFGAGVNWAVSQSDTTDAIMLAPPENGERQFVHYEDCVSERSEGD